MHAMEPQVVVLVNQTFQFLVGDLHVKEFTISITRCAGDGANTPSGTRILFRDLLPILGVCRPTTTTSLLSTLSLSSHCRSQSRSRSLSLLSLLSSLLLLSLLAELAREVSVGSGDDDRTRTRRRLFQRRDVCNHYAK